MIKSLIEKKIRRKERNTYRINQINKNNNKIRLVIRTSIKNIYANITQNGSTIICANTLQSRKLDGNKNKLRRELSIISANSLSQKFNEKYNNINQKDIIYDLGGSKYTGIIKIFLDEFKKNINK